MRPLRRKGSPNRGPRLRPASIDAQLREAQEHALRHGEHLVDRTSLVLYRDARAVDLWPDDPEVHAERAEVYAILDEYRAAIGYSGPRDEAPAGGREQGDEGNEA